MEQQTFVEATHRPASGIVREFVAFLLASKKWWLAPVLLVLALLAVLMFLSSTPAAPFIYTLF